MKRSLSVWMVSNINSIHTTRVAEMLINQGLSVTVVTPVHGRENKLPEGVNIIEHPRPTYRLPKLGTFESILKIHWLWRKHRPDVVHAHYIATEAWHCAMARIHPLVATCWGSDIHSTIDKNEAGLSRSRIQYVLRHADVVTADSESLLNDADALAGGLNSKMTWRIGIDMNKFRPGLATESLRQRIGLKPGQRLILSPRAMRPLMNHHLVLEAFGRLAPRFPETMLAFKTYCMHFTEAGEYYSNLRVRASELGLADRVLFLPDIDYDEMPLLYNLADIVVNIPSRDGMPMTLFEAMGCARPCIVADLDAYRELTRVTPEPVLLVTNEVERISHAMEQILGDESLARRIGDAARERALTFGDQERETERLLAVYKMLLNKQLIKKNDR